MADELVALSTKKPFNELAGRAASKGGEMLSLIWKAGELAKKAKASLPHGEWMAFVETHYDVSHDTVARWIKFHDGYAESKLRNVRNLSDGLRMLAPPKSTTPKPAPKPTPPPPPAADSPDAPEAPPEPSEPEGDSESPEPPEAPETTPGDEPCPNCRGTKWTEDEEGWACAKCSHPYGEPAGDVDGDRIQTQRQKTVKTVEALQRAFDDLQAMKSKQEHDKALKLCAELLGIAKGWK